MEDLDKICPDAELVLLEGEIHSNWANSKVYELHGITDDTPDPVPGLAYYVRKDGHLTGNSFESASWVFVFDSLANITPEQIDPALDRWIEYCKSDGVSAVFELAVPILGDRAYKQLRCKTLWDSGALVAWSSDNVAFTDFMTWSPYLGMEIGMTRWANEKTRVPEYNRIAAEYPPAEEKMSVEEMLLGYTINGAFQLGVEDSKGSIEAGKDADFLVFDNDLLTADPHGFSYNKPVEVYFGGVKMN